MKKLLSFLLALMLLLGLAACGESAEPDPNAGLYEARSAEMWGITVQIEDVFEDGFSLELKNGGKAVFHYDGKDYNLKWTLDGDVFHAEGGGAELDGTLADGVMLLENVLDSGLQITLVCDALLPQMLDGPGELAEPERYEPVLDALATLPVYDAEQTLAMSNWINWGRVLIEDDMFYGRFFVKGGADWTLIAMQLTRQGADIRVGDWRELDGGSWPTFLNKRGDTLFYARNEKGTDEASGIARVNVDGSELRTLYEGACNFLSVVGDRLYFIDGDARLVSTDLDGGDLQIVLDKEVYYPYPLDAEWFVYQDDDDHESLHLYHLPDGIDIKLNDEPSYQPQLCGSMLFFTVELDDVEGADHLACIDLSDYTEEWDEELGCHVPRFTTERSEKLFAGVFFCDGEVLYPSNNFNAVTVANWRDLEDDAYQGYTQLKNYLSADYIVESSYGPDGSYQGMEFFDRHSNYGNAMPWLTR